MVERCNPQRTEEVGLQWEDMLNGGGGRRARWGLVVQPDEFIKHRRDSPPWTSWNRSSGSFQAP